MILDLNADVLPFLQLSADDSFGNVARIQAECEAYFQSYCGRNFVVTTMREIIRRNPEESVFLKEYPVVSVQKLAIGSQSALTVTNSNSTTTAQVSVSATGVSLSYNYGTATILSFSNYATLAALASAINAAGNGWSGSIVAGFENYLSSELVPQMTLECINNTSASLAVPNHALTGYQLNELTGEVIFLGGGAIQALRENHAFGRDCSVETAYTPSKENIYAYYTGGYAAIPYDLKLGILTLISSVYDKANEGLLNLKTFKIESLAKDLLEVPSETRAVLELYKRRRF